MTTNSSRWNQLFLLLLLTLPACKSPSAGTEGDSSSHWLKACVTSSDCGGDFPCVHGVCTDECESQNYCAEDSVCALWDGEQAIRACTRTCDSEADCGQLECRDHTCLPPTTGPRLLDAATQCAPGCEVAVYELKQDCVDTTNSVVLGCACNDQPEPNTLCIHSESTNTDYIGSAPATFVESDEKLSYCNADFAALASCETQQLCQSAPQRVLCAVEAYCNEFASIPYLTCGGQQSLLDAAGCLRPTCDTNDQCAEGAVCQSVDCDRVPTCFGAPGECSCMTTNEPCQPRSVCVEQ